MPAQTPSLKASNRSVVYAIATMDTKGPELAFLAEQIERAGAKAVTIDVGTAAPPLVPPGMARESVAQCHADGIQSVLGHTDRGQAVTAMSEALVRFLEREFAAGKFAGVIGIGGSGGTAIVAPAMRALPVGFPKLLVSTLASGNVQPYVGCCDITMMYSVVDVAGINRVSQEVLTNAANAIAGMTLGHKSVETAKPTIAMTMFGVTTPCVTAVRESLEHRGYDCLVFHATGTGGRAMEKLVASSMIEGVLDITTTEVADEVVGGILSAGPQRFDALLEQRVPLVLSLGALDMVNFGAMDTVPERFRDRRLHAHNAQVTLMRTTAEENRQFARWIAQKLNRSSSPVTVLIPEGGVSAIDAPGQPFYDPEADAALFSELETVLEPAPTRRLQRWPNHINDPEFASALVDAYLAISQSP
jgi:uncharacterized protein (UPF0261 family)